MRFVRSALVGLTLLATVTPLALATETEAEARNRAIGICRAAITSVSTPAPSAIDFVTGVLRGAFVRSEFRLRQDGQSSQTAICTVRRRDGTITDLRINGQTVTPPAATAVAAR